MSKELIDRLKSYIPSGYGHNSQYANDLADAVAILESNAAPVGEREAFEAHMRVCGYSNPDKHPDGSYVSSAMELWWQGWKARVAHQRQQAREVVMPERKQRPDWFKHMPSHYECWNACLDEFARLNKGAGSHE